MMWASPGRRLVIYKIHFAIAILKCLTKDSSDHGV